MIKQAQLAYVACLKLTASARQTAQHSNYSRVHVSKHYLQERGRHQGLLTTNKQIK